MPITAERLKVEVTADTAPAEKGLERVSSKGKATNKIIKDVQGLLPAFGAAAVIGGVGKVVMAASDLNETVSKTGVVFGDQTKQVTGYAQQMADKFGLPKTAVLDAASSFGLLGKAAGLSGGKVASMSTNLAGLAADASSFYNVPLDQALEDFRSGLTGEAEPLRKYGVLINEAAVQTQALAMGIVKPVTNTKKLAAAQLSAKVAQQALTKAIKDHGPKSIEAQKAQQALAAAQDRVAAAAKGTVPQLTEGQKVQARAALITKGLADASGDLERTQSSVSNRMRELKGRVLNTAADLGTKLLPATAAVLGGMIDLFDYMGKAVGFIHQHSTAFKIMAGILLTVFGPALVMTGAKATAAKVKVVAAWVAQKAAAIGSAAAQWKSMLLMVRGWVMAGVAAAKSAAETVALWTMYRVESAKAAASAVASSARAAAAWVAGTARMAAVAAANMARMVATTVAGWAVQAAAAVASMARTVATTVAGWVLMGTQSLIQAARMAAAWVIAMGPVGWVIAAVIALVALIIANWDTVKRVTAAAWGWVAAKSKAVWAAITGAIGAAVNVVKAVVRVGFAIVKAYITTYVTVWRTIITTAWRVIMAVVNGAVNAVKAYIRTLAAIGGWIAGYVARAKDAVVRGFSTVVGWVRGLGGRIKGALGNLGGLLYDSGKAIIQGLINGIRNMAGNVYGAVRDVLGKARRLLPFSPAKEGPFSGKGWTRYSGQSIVGSLADGMRERAGMLRKAALATAQAAVPPLGGLDVPGTAVAPPQGRRGRAVTAPQVAAPVGAERAPVTFQFNTYYPVAEKQSQTTNKALQRVAALGLA